MTIDDLPVPYRTQLLSMYRGEPQQGADGQTHAIDTKVRIPKDQGLWLYQTCLDRQPQATLEIGLAYGYSTLFLLAALFQNGVGRHTAVDPFQHAHWGGIGSTHAANTPTADRFQLRETFSISALEELHRAQANFDFIYIDGNHRFDDVLVDFTLAARICPVGGLIVLDDLWMPSVKAVTAFLTQNRTDFATVATGHDNIAAFERRSDDTRAWSHYVEFRDDVKTSPLKTLKRTLLRR